MGNAQQMIFEKSLNLFTMTKKWVVMGDS
jgi:hypothetical protein